MYVGKRSGGLISRFRTELARASVHALEPDLIILDEFQRFRELLDRSSGSEAADLAHALFEFGNAKVLLLSATPIKSFTLAEEALDGDDHERDRYGTARQSDEAARLPEIRAAFNSPFWPWVLATTSVGQEGIDFHWWCSSIVHWNTPANPVDFEQREGRVNRYGGLAIRRNIAHRHRAAVLRAGAISPWAVAYELGLDERENLGELAPHWVYPGPARIHRTVLPFPLSTDAARYRRLKDDLALYRLTFGQPRREDLLEILKRRGVQHDPARADELRLRLNPPPSRELRR